MSNINEAIGWKFNNQSGMSCKAVNGVMRITEFPGGIPSQAQQDQWTSEYDAHIASGGHKDEEANRKMNDAKRNSLVDAFHELENRIRTLEGRPPVDRSVVFGWLLAKYRSYL